MKRTVLLSLLGTMMALCVLPSFARAKEICIWQFDSLDRYYEPKVETRVRCTWGLRKALSALGHNVHVYNALPEDLSSYDLVFVSLGWSRG